MDDETKPVMSVEWLEANGFKRSPLLGYVRHLSDGPEDTRLDIAFGTYPLNELCVSIIIAGFGIVTSAENTDDILALVRMLEGSPIDHPYVAEIDNKDFDEL